MASRASIQAKLRRKNNPQRALEIERNARYKRKYGINYEEVERLFVAQQGCCAICSYKAVDTSALHVDHCHTTGEVRGLLCIQCNTGLGYFKDDIDRMEAAIGYLRNSTT